jgi:hypothetical protein
MTHAERLAKLSRTGELYGRQYQLPLAQFRWGLRSRRQEASLGAEHDDEETVTLGCECWLAVPVQLVRCTALCGPSTHGKRRRRCGGAAFAKTRRGLRGWPADVPSRGCGGVCPPPERKSQLARGLPGFPTLTGKERREQ